MKEVAGIILILPAVLIVVVIGLGLYRFVQFWIGFAQGISGGGEPRGFEVKQTTGAGPAPVLPEKEHDHG